MKILALESSALAASVCLIEEERPIARFWQNSGLTHSKTLLPMAEQMLASCGEKLEDVDVIAVAAGPGSFTGLRIGVSAAKGLAWALDKPCAKVSTLEAMAWNLSVCAGEICPVMDARRNQVYNARFSSDRENITRLTPDRAIALEELARELKNGGQPQILVGDGAQLCYNYCMKEGLPVRMAPANLRFQDAWGVARAALDQARQGKLITAGELAPEYHRLSQAERERLEREQEQTLNRTKGE
ncbi:MAG: tRNA (adenosine(37)-N6)-threonylcarbamoyltransferase complex dimerization subunit type 1 TsaB [Oscillospiraceae bacterium]|nr:tRNA (adenosine(37)-N6)-threonylcarbamoyltransferase complex dimerization subunit type 1 TsaB [Oscillospiraceae bacterium]